MQQTRKNLLNLYTKVAAHMRRHRFLYILLSAIIILYFLVKIFFTPPLLSDIQFGNAYFDRNGELLRITLSPDEKYRLYTPLSEINETLKEATILYEDKYFKYHIGINPISLIKAGFKYFSPESRHVGASTITMQVARLKYDMNTTNIPGKLRQIAAAIYIDLFYSKDEILEAYLNLAPYGGNIESIGAASLIYFDKKASDLTKIEAITLSTIPQNPGKRSLNTQTGLSNIMKMRKNLVLRWVKENPNDKDLIPLCDLPLHVRTTKNLPFFAPHFINYVSKQQTEHWAASNKNSSNITTTLDLKLQTVLEKALNNEITKRKRIGITNAAAILLNYKTMEVLAYIGSANYFNANIYGENDGVRAKRSPGSTLKPLIYATATDMGYIHSMTLLKDAKINFGVYAPENADNEFFGPILAKDALTHSRNIPAINLLKKIGVQNFYKILLDSGVTGLKAPEHYGISIALGGAEVSMLELATIYSTMANLGMKYDIRITKQDEKGPGSQILSPEAFFIVLDMLGQQKTPSKNIPFTTNAPQNITHYWKTGTSSSFRDAWTAGIFGDFVLIVWVGNFDGTPNNSFSGAKTAAPIYFSLSDTVTRYYSRHGEQVKNNNFLRQDLNISKIEMCEKVGGLAGKYCPKSTYAYFIPGKSPIEVSSIYRAIPIDNATGLRACSNNPNTTHLEVYEFWDAEYLEMFKKAGIHKKTPPAFMAGCNLDFMMTSHNPPVILSPQKDTRVVIVSNSDSQQITFKAISEVPDAKLFWFLDDNLIGTTQSDEALLYNVQIGQHTVRTIDEIGGWSTIKFSVIK